MITAIITAILGAIITLYNSIKEYRPFYLIEEYVITFLRTIIMGFMAGLVGVLIAIALPCETFIQKTELNLESLQDSKGMSGNFFLGSGQFGDKMKYVFYIEQDDTYEMVSVDYNLVKIKYSESKPICIVSEVRPTESWINLFGTDTDIGDKTYLIQVPKGTIQNYNLDAQ